MTAAPPFRFWLGTHRPHWLGTLDVPCFVSWRSMRGRKTYPSAREPWALDSGGFTEITHAGRWTITADEYADSVATIAAETGRLAWACPQDWVCAPDALAASGMAVAEHVERTVASYLELTAVAPSLPWAPVLQGWDVADYLRCHELYQQAGVDLHAAPIVCIGSIAARSGEPAVAIVRALAETGLPLHGLGVKRSGLALYGEHLASADSIAWSWAARWQPPLPGCQHRRCNNCARWALAWRRQVLDAYAGRLRELDADLRLF